MNDRTTKQALITGASSGIGKATALGFAAVGINLALVSRESENLEAVATAAREFGVKAEAYPLDLAKIEQVQSGISEIAAQFGPVDILVNSAGMGYTGSLTETPLADWQNVLDLNLTSVWQCILGILPGMRDRRSGIIINVSSIAGTQTFPNWGAYCVSKFGLMALSKTLAAEERAGGIRVTAICPGSVNTPMWDTESVQADFDRSAMLTPEIVAQSILHAVQLPTSAVIEEITLMSNAGVL
ncbi:MULTISPECIES: SDR family oxidoreductase [unclassified Microcoleus]|jgi:short-subunit dehydrogenase|uniref:SDR family oxidoreductase n=1 Tax=unclassified Microcoleus TaxID=2642155 RepID=UPI001E10E8A5|nr:MULTISPECIES: SDR family oxidoreductase [unclassified Microcoleus]MCC3442865.1 SDR family oxidoreductase [Microcoleus sp. PH2017_03_ELD_O_A]MCC3505334.1 SDR family oxidoreductase [Microcoleus sp. PH2017_19_SFW_U_A]MCC3510582.1 SDR family oxidoreductase [Microcoleus sp. PH2017_17_BER_D_A]TAE08146.1 MAG: SDR family oxidoreductase [Oscillatoriales cyanobacterium]MCC3438529.1 SDR family oxidoreductase [Microcoleus sp. PH2017_05_CCC_O_A]